MAFPASTQIKVDALQDVRRHALRMKERAQSRRDQLNAGDSPSSLVLEVLRDMVDSIALFDRIASVPGIGTYAQEQYEDLGLDVAAEFSAVRAAAVSVRDWIVTNMPTDVDGWLLLRSIDLDGNLSDRTFTKGQTAGLRTELDNLIATIS